MTSMSGFGTLIKIGDGATTEVFTTVAQVKSISGPGLSMDAIDATHHSSTAGWREYIGGLLDGGEVSFDINYDPVENTHDAGTGLLKDMSDKTVRNFQVVFPDTATTTWTVAALVTGFEVGAPIDDILSAAVTLKLSGQPTLA